MSVAGAVWSTKARFFYHCRLYAAGLRVAGVRAWVHAYARLSYFIADWVLTTNHRRLAILYFAMIAITGFTGLVLATIIRLELAYPGQYFLAKNAERYLTTISLHGIIMVFYVVIPLLFGAFGNFLLPTQLGIRDVAFPRLNSFMFWVTPAGFVMLLHILLFDRAYNVTYWVNYSELRARLRRRFLTAETPEAEFRSAALSPTALSLRLHAESEAARSARSLLVQQYAPQVSARPFSMLGGQATLASAVGEAGGNLAAIWDLVVGVWGIFGLEAGIAFFWAMGRVLAASLAQGYDASFQTLAGIGRYAGVQRVLAWYWTCALGLVDWPHNEGIARLVMSVREVVAGRLTDMFLLYGAFYYAGAFWLCSETPSSQPLVKQNEMTAGRSIEAILTLARCTLSQGFRAYFTYGLSLHCWTSGSSVIRWALPAIWDLQVVLNQLADRLAAVADAGLQWYLLTHWLSGLLRTNSTLVAPRDAFIRTCAGLRELVFDVAELVLTLSLWGYGREHRSGVVAALLPIGLQQQPAFGPERSLIRWLANTIADFVVALELHHCLISGLNCYLSIWGAYSYSSQWIATLSIPACLRVGPGVRPSTLLEVPALWRQLLQSWKGSILWLWGADFLEILVGASNADFGVTWTALSLTQVWAPLSDSSEAGFAARMLISPALTIDEPVWLSLVSGHASQPSVAALNAETEVVVEGVAGFSTNLSAAEEGVRGGRARAQTVGREESLNGLLQDWRELKLEREVWRSLDLLGQSRQSLSFRRKYYAELFEPASMTSKVSSWMPNHLIPGWAFVTPYSSRLRYTALGKVDVALVAIFAAGLGSVLSSLNYVITYRYIGAPILKNRRELRSFFVDALLVASRMMIAANPALLIAVLLLLSDRHFNTSVFDFSGGGDAVLFQHLFWFFGHPEVYIIVIPCFGFMNSLLPQYLRKRLSGRLSLQFSMYTIAFMGFAVWGHHMYMVGLANSVRTLYSTMTVMISVPASTKVLHWCVTLVQSTLVLEVGFLFLLNFMYFFVLGGLSGMFVAHIGFDTMYHDTFYVIGHFHVMLAGASVSCIFAAFYFYFSAIFGIRYSRFFAYLHYGLYTGGQLLTLIPMFWLGYAGMPRRIMDYPAAFGGWHSMVSSGHFLTVLSLVFFLIMLLDSFYENRAPSQRMRGVGRLNTRLSFYAYECRKLQHFQSRALALTRTNRVSTRTLYQFCWTAETAAVEYVFRSQSK